MSKSKVILKQLFACLFALFLLLGISGCGREEAEELPEATDSLVVYAGPYVADFLKTAVTRFSSLYPDVSVQVRDFGDDSDVQNEENYLGVLKNELAAGAGPDLILFTSDEFEDMQKTAESGVFQDLSGYIADDTDFNLADYNSAVLEAGVTDGQRLFIPLSYSVDVLLTTQETLAGASQKLPTSLQELYQQMADYGQTYRDDTNRFFTPFSIFSSLIQSSGLSIVDYTSKEVTIDNDGFRGLIDAYKELYEMDWVRSENGISAVNLDCYYGENVLLVESGKILYIHEYTQLSLVWDYAGLLSDQTPVYTTFPSASGRPIATFNMCAAVNSNGKNKCNAYNLLKIMLTTGMQSYGYENVCYAIPVLNGVLKDCIAAQSEEHAGQGVGTPIGTYMFAPIPDATIDEFVSLVSDVTCSYVSKSVQGFVWEEMQPYFKGQKSYEECMESLKNKLNLYINE